MPVPIPVCADITQGLFLQRSPLSLLIRAESTWNVQTNEGRNVKKFVCSNTTAASTREMISFTKLADSLRVLTAEAAALFECILKPIFCSCTRFCNKILLLKTVASWRLNYHYSHSRLVLAVITLLDQKRDCQNSSPRRRIPSATSLQFRTHVDCVSLQHIYHPLKTKNILTLWK